jgi:uncharacterized protein YwlG (UPF0340 family)
MHYDDPQHRPLRGVDLCTVSTNSGASNMARVRTNSTYIFRPVLIDKTNPPYGVEVGILKAGDKVKVVRLPGCPPPNTMGHAHIAIAETGEFAGLVATNSLNKD